MFISLDGLQYKKLSPKLLQKKYGEFFGGRIFLIVSFGSVTIFLKGFKLRYVHIKTQRTNETLEKPTQKKH